MEPTKQESTTEPQSCKDDVIDSVSWREKLQAFMEGLEIENIDEFLLKAKKGDYRKLGEVMTDRIKRLSRCR
jgi:hypothetical protein